MAPGKKGDRQEIRQEIPPAFTDDPRAFEEKIDIVY